MWMVVGRVLFTRFFFYSARLYSCSTCNDLVVRSALIDIFVSMLDRKPGGERHSQSKTHSTLKSQVSYIDLILTNGCTTAESCISNVCPVSQPEVAASIIARGREDAGHRREEAEKGVDGRDAAWWHARSGT